MIISNAISGEVTKFKIGLGGSLEYLSTYQHLVTKANVSLETSNFITDSYLTTRRTTKNGVEVTDFYKYRTRNTYTLPNNYYTLAYSRYERDEFTKWERDWINSVGIGKKFPNIHSSIDFSVGYNNRELGNSGIIRPSYQFKYPLSVNSNLKSGFAYLIGNRYGLLHTHLSIEHTIYEGWALELLGSHEQYISETGSEKEYTNQIISILLKYNFNFK